MSRPSSKEGTEITKHDFGERASRNDMNIPLNHDFLPNKKSATFLDDSQNNRDIQNLLINDKTLQN